MKQVNIFIRDGSIAVKQPDGTPLFWWMGEEDVTLLQLLARVCFAMAFNHPGTDFTITDQRTFKPVPTGEDNRVDLSKAA